MARLGAAERARLPDSAFAYIDGRGRRRLPIHDADHVRNALARFNQVNFEDDAARDRARRRLLNAARRFRIVPVGFITSQLESERDLGRRADEAVGLPSGFVTMLLTDVEGSTALVHRLGDGYGDLLERLRALHAMPRSALVAMSWRHAPTSSSRSSSNRRQRSPWPSGCSASCA